MATVLLIGGGSFRILQDFYRRQMIDSLAASTTVQGELIEQSLRYAMHMRSLDLLAQMVQGLADQQGVEKVMILNKHGVIRFSSDALEQGRMLARSDPTCKICHQHGSPVRGRTVIFDTARGQRVFRNVNPILNSESCMGCHPASDRVNGVLIVDYSMAGIETSLSASANKMWLSAITLAVAITLVIVALMRRVVLRRLRGLVDAVHAIAAGNLDTPADERGHDEISLLGRNLNRMAGSLERSLDALRQREAYLDSVINSADDGIVVVDDALRIVTANQAFGALRAAERRRLVDASCLAAPMCNLHGPEDCPARRTFATGEVSRRIHTVAGGDGTMRHYEISASPLRQVTGRPQVLEVWRDITRRRQLEAKLAHSEQLASLGFLASGISHEINNPLASITTCLDGLGRRLRQRNGREMPPELPEYLGLIRGEVERCRDLTERLKLLGRKPQLTRRAIDLVAVIHDTLALVRYESRKHAVEIEEDLQPGVPPVMAGDAQMRQLVLNLVMNAIQAIDDGPGQVRVSLRAPAGGVEDGSVELEIADSGRGIQPADRQRIFEPFYSARPDGRGTGLGLFITKILVDQLEGSIEVASVPGEGTRFTLRLPPAAERESATGVETAAPADGASTDAPADGASTDAPATPGGGPRS